MANAEAALLFSFSAALLLLLARRDAIADLLLPALDRFFHLDGRTLLDLATRRNMIMLCHAILLLILRDAGVLGAPARRRAATTGTASAVVAAAAAADAEGACSAPPQPRATSVVVWRRPRSSDKDAGVDESARRLARRRQPPRRSLQKQTAAAAAIPCAAPALTLEPEQAPLVSKEIVLVEKATTTTTSYLVNDHDLDGKGESDRRIVVADDDRMDVNAAAEDDAPELADDRRIEEFIAKQRRNMWQESLQLVRPSGSYQQAIPT